MLAQIKLPFPNQQQNSSANISDTCYFREKGNVIFSVWLFYMIKQREKVVDQNPT